MTMEKRFTLHKDYGIHDHLKSVIHDIETTNGVLDVIQELNILHYGIDECNRYMHRTDAEIQGLKKENHMLKCALALDDVEYLISDNGEKIKIPPYDEFENKSIGEIKLREVDTAYGELQRFKYIIRESIKNERTDLGRSVLKQLADNLGLEL